MDWARRSWGRSTAKKIRLPPCLEGPLPLHVVGRIIEAFGCVGLSEATVIKTLKNYLENNLENIDDLIENEFEVEVNRAECLDLYCLETKARPAHLDSTPMFCCPNGLKIRKFSEIDPKQSAQIEGEATAFNFVLTNLAAENYRAANLSFQEIMTVLVPVKSKSDTSDTSESETVYRVVVSVTKCLWLVSKWPYLNTLKECLVRILGIMRQQDPNAKQQIESIIATLLQLPLIKSPLSVDWIIPLGTHTTPLRFRCMPDSNHFPIVDFSMRYLFVSLDISSIIKLICAVLSERSVLFISSSYSLLTLATETIKALLHPFSWVLVYVPLTPLSLIDHLGAPTPYIMGCQSDVFYLMQREVHLSDDVIIVDLDNRKVDWRDQPILMMPTEELEFLQSTLIRHVYPETFDMDRVIVDKMEDDLFSPESIHQKCIRVAFFTVFASLLCNYQSYYKTPGFSESEYFSSNLLLDSSDAQDTQPTFDKQEFVALQPKPKQQFLQLLVETQAFQQFESQKIELFENATSLGPPIQNGRSKISDYLLSKFPPPGRPLTASNPQLVRNTSKSGTSSSSIFSNSPSQFDKESIIHLAGDYSHVIEELTTLINKNRSIEHYYLRAIFSMLSKDILAALQDFDKVLEISPSYEIERSIMNYLWSTLEELESNADWLAINQRDFANVGPLIRTRISFFNRSRSLTRSRARSFFNSSGLQEVLVQEINGENTAEDEDAIHFIDRVTNTAETADVFYNNKLSFSEYLNYCVENRWPYSSEYLLSLFDRLRKKNNSGESYIRIARIIGAFRELKERRPKMLELANITLDLNEIVLMTCTASNIHGSRGELFLTNKRLIFVSKKIYTENSSSKVRYNEANHECDNIRTKDDSIIIVGLALFSQVEKFNFVVVIPPGLPCVKIEYKKSLRSTSTEKMTFCILTERKHWYNVFDEICIAERISRDLHDTSIVNMAILNIILTEVIVLLTDKKTKEFFSFHGKSTNWLTIKKTLERCPLNEDTEDIPSPLPYTDFLAYNPSGYELSRALLTNVIEIFFSVLVQNENVGINLEKVRTLEEFGRYKTIAARLKEFNLSSLNTKEESYSFFVNIYNALVMHSLLLIGFPSNKLEWRYVARSACYHIGSLPYTLDFIQHGILRKNNPHPWIKNPTKRRYDANDPRFANLNIGPNSTAPLDIRLMFLLCSHNDSSPCLRIIKPKNLEKHLDTSVTEYLETNVHFGKQEVVLPKMFKWFKTDLDGDIFDWIAPFLSEAKRKELTNVLADCAAKNVKVSIRHCYEWSPAPKPFRQYL